MYASATCTPSPNISYQACCLSRRYLICMSWQYSGNRLIFFKFSRKYSGIFFWFLLSTHVMSLSNFKVELSHISKCASPCGCLIPRWYVWNKKFYMCWVLNLYVNGNEASHMIRNVIHILWCHQFKFFIYVRYDVIILNFKNTLLVTSWNKKKYDVIYKIQDELGTCSFLSILN